LKSTVITPHLEQPIEPGTNVLWCGTFQLAWNEVCSLIGEDIHFQEDPAMVGPLNKKTFTGEMIDQDSYVALAGFVREGIFEKINKALDQKFKGQADPVLLPSRLLTLRPQDIVAYSYLFKHMEFPVPFERLEQPVVFAGTPLGCFGFAEYKPDHQKLYQQVRILNYQNPDKFIIELQTKSKSDRLILAKMQPGKTLFDTINKVGRNIQDSKAINPTSGDVLIVPRINFDLTRQYNELYGLRLITANERVAKDLLVLYAGQNIRFQMDEKGVRLRSEATMQFGCSAQRLPEPQHIMIFDKPFLIILQRENTEVPYFALWVDNAELFTPKQD